MDTQFSQPCHDKVGSSCVKIGIISSTKRKDIQQFVKELTHSDKFDLCQQILELNGLDKFKPPSEWNAVILLHSANLGRISLTDVENAWYDQLLKDLYNDKGKDAICIIAHDVKGWQDDLREEQLLNIQCDQKSAFNHSKHVIICNKLDTMHEKDSEILNDFLGKVYHAVTGKQLKTEDAMKPVVDQSEGCCSAISRMFSGCCSAISRVFSGCCSAIIWMICCCPGFRNGQRGSSSIKETSKLVK